MFFGKRRIRRNRINFYISLCCSSIIFIMGLLYILIPAIYGFETMEILNANSLFVCSMLIYATMGFGEFILLKDIPDNDLIYQSINCAICGIFNLLLSELTTANMRIMISLSVYLVLYSLIKCFYIEALHQRKDALQYIEITATIPYVLVGICLVILLPSGAIMKAISLGFMMILYSILKFVVVAVRTMTKSKRFLNKLK